MNCPESAGVALLERPDHALLFKRFDEHLTAGRFLRDVHRLAADLPDADFVCNLCHDRYRFTVTFVAAALRGQICLLSSDRSPGTLQAMRDRFGVTIAAVDAEAGDSQTVSGSLPRYIVALPDDPVRGNPANPRLPESRVVARVFTSGSTGSPVGHDKTWGGLAARSRSAGRRFGMAASAPAGIVGTVPPQHMYGFETTILQPLHAPAATWSGPAFYPADIGAALAAMPAPRMLISTPLQIRALLEAGTTLPPLACVISATAPLDAALAARAEQRWQTQVLEIFGATEVGSIASRRTLDGPVWTTYDDIRLVTSDPASPAFVTAPLATPHPLADTIEPVSPNRFTLHGRSADMVKLGGRRASLAGLNAILCSLPGVVDGIFVVPGDLDERPGARLLAFVTAPTRSNDDILAELRRHIEPVFLPRRIVRVPALPRNEVGKVPRAALLELIGAVDEAS